MKSLIALAAIVAVNLQPGLNAPSTDGAVRVDAAVLVSTNAVATSRVAAVYDLPLYGQVESVEVVTNDVLATSTRTVVGTNETLAVTDLYTLSTNPTDRVTSLYNVVTNTAGISETNYLYIATNYFTVWTNSYPVEVLSPVVSTITNLSLEITGHMPVTNDLFSLTASGGYAETNNVFRYVAAPGRALSGRALSPRAPQEPAASVSFLLVGEPLTLIIEK